MAKVWIPTNLYRLTGNKKIVQVEGKRVVDIVNNLEKMFPEIKEHLVENDELFAGMAVFVDGEQSLQGLLEHVKPESEIHFLPAIGGG